MKAAKGDTGSSAACCSRHLEQMERLQWSGAEVATRMVEKCGKSERDTGIVSTDLLATVVNVILEGRDWFGGLLASETNHVGGMGRHAEWQKVLLAGHRLWENSMQNLQTHQRLLVEVCAFVSCISMTSLPFTLKETETDSCTPLALFDQCLPTWKHTDSKAVKTTCNSTLTCASQLRDPSASGLCVESNLTARQAPGERARGEEVCEEQPRSVDFLTDAKRKIVDKVVFLLQPVLDLGAGFMASLRSLLERARECDLRIATEKDEREETYRAGACEAPLPTKLIEPWVEEKIVGGRVGKGLSADSGASLRTASQFALPVVFVYGKQSFRGIPTTDPLLTDRVSVHLQSVGRLHNAFMQPLFEAAAAVEQIKFAFEIGRETDTGGEALILRPFFFSDSSSSTSPVSRFGDQGTFHQKKLETGPTETLSAEAEKKKKKKRRDADNKTVESGWGVDGDGEAEAEGRYLEAPVLTGKFDLFVSLELIPGGLPDDGAVEALAEGIVAALENSVGVAVLVSEKRGTKADISSSVLPKLSRAVGRSLGLVPEGGSDEAAQGEGSRNAVAQDEGIPMFPLSTAVGLCSGPVRSPFCHDSGVMGQSGRGRGTTPEKEAKEESFIEKEKRLRRERIERRGNSLALLMRRNALSPDFHDLPVQGKEAEARPSSASSSAEGEKEDWSESLRLFHSGVDLTRLVKRFVSCRKEAPAAESSSFSSFEEVVERPQGTGCNRQEGPRFAISLPIRCPPLNCPTVLASIFTELPKLLPDILLRGTPASPSDPPVSTHEPRGTSHSDAEREVNRKLVYRRGGGEKKGALDGVWRNATAVDLWEWEERIDSGAAVRRFEEALREMSDRQVDFAKNGREGVDYRENLPEEDEDEDVLGHTPLTYLCTRRFTCGGSGDRMNGLLFVLLTALLVRRPFRACSIYPLPLQLFLRPPPRMSAGRGENKSEGEWRFPCSDLWGDVRSVWMLDAPERAVTVTEALLRERKRAENGRSKERETTSLIEGQGEGDDQSIWSLSEVPLSISANLRAVHLIAGDRGLMGARAREVGLGLEPYVARRLFRSFFRPTDSLDAVAAGVLCRAFIDGRKRRRKSFVTEKESLSFWGAAESEQTEEEEDECVERIRTTGRPPPFVALHFRSGGSNSKGGWEDPPRHGILRLPSFFRCAGTAEASLRLPPSVPWVLFSDTDSVWEWEAEPLEAEEELGKPESSESIMRERRDREESNPKILVSRLREEGKLVRVTPSGPAAHVDKSPPSIAVRGAADTFIQQRLISMATAAVLSDSTFGHLAVEFFGDRIIPAFYWDGCVPLDFG
uniref:Uncharacterized protein n=1 Tax=Chromera velia CCMP2878 TaxID=1169474 RepID=A0A0G4IA51_9ALVE|eukprot:Cvel_12433.t1-p1 / transcript=Cvel_12433.t1 / gene=Cvel_12433 / organism=Chromera_velia_CCMP2878 / gene_product=hypothetical protein / transcript_product=hypothetical protein / location=Cvel_scaffold813:51363-58644(-) / protein_length=1309 / sequence_SO=supercontig / SO=protein_coding / is_pseudo=false